MLICAQDLEITPLDLMVTVRPSKVALFTYSN